MIDPVMSAHRYARSPDVHRALSAIFKHWSLENGFRKLPGRGCRFVKQARSNPGLILAFEVQCNSFGGSAHGGLFALNAAAGEMDPASLSGRHARILENCSARMAEEANRLEARIVKASTGLGETGRPWQPGVDNWCRYYTREDVEMWGRFLVPYLPEILRGLLNKVFVPTEEFFEH